ncbi:MAG: hypothetical protein J2P45_29395 [Candidatus Dormibacteraeota bacterium]|nr:hypothetical protein [Candidatus Dormibacteraeota bacterium]
MSEPRGQADPPHRGRQASPLMRRWEALSPGIQAAIAGPVLVVILFFVNLVPFNQPAWRSVLYGIFEGGVLTGLLLVATQTEKSKRS